MLASREEWSLQSPALPPQRRQIQIQTNKAAAPPTNTSAGHKRKGVTHNNTHRRVYEHAIPDEEDDSTLNGPHRLAPCFGLIPNHLIQPTSDAPNTTAAPAVPSSTPAASAVSSSSSSSTSGIIFHSGLVPSLSKRARKSLQQDYSSFKSSLSTQAMRTLNETLMRNILRMKDCSEEMMKEASNLPHEDDANMEYHFTSIVQDALANNAKKVGEEPSLENVKDRLQTTASSSNSANKSGGADASDDSDDDDDDPPITSFGTHQPRIRSTFPDLGSETRQHGWTFYQPTRSHTIGSFNTRWVRQLQSELSEFLVVLQLLRTSFTLSLPSAGDTNNLDVEIMEEMLTELKDHSDWSQHLRTRLSHYSEQRGKLLSKVYKVRERRGQ